MTKILTRPRAGLLQAYQVNNRYYDTDYCGEHNWALTGPDHQVDMGVFADRVGDVLDPTYQNGIHFHTNITRLRIQEAIISKYHQSGAAWFADGTAWDFSDHLGLSLFANFEAQTIDGTAYLTWQSKYYTDETSTDNPHPFTFLNNGANGVTWGHIFNEFWEGYNYETAMCMPIFPTTQEEAELAMTNIIFPRTGTTIQNRSVPLWAEMAVDRSITNPAIEFTVIDQDGNIVFSDIAGQGHLVTGTHIVKPSFTWMPTNTTNYTFTVQVDADNRFVEQNEGNNAGSHRDLVLDLDAPAIEATVDGNPQWVTTLNATLDITQTLGMAPASTIIAQIYGYTDGSSPNAHVPQLLDTQTLSGLSLPQQNYQLTLPANLKAGHVVVHFWGTSTGGVSSEPAIVVFNYVPADTVLDDDEIHYFLVQAEAGDSLQLDLAMNNGDGHLYVWQPHTYGAPDYVVGAGSLTIDPAPFTGEYLIAVEGTQDSSSYTLTASRNGQVAGSSLQPAPQLDRNLVDVPTQRPIFEEVGICPPNQDCQSLPMPIQLYLPVINK